MWSCIRLYFSRQRIANAPVIWTFTCFARWLYGIFYLFTGPDIINRYYEKVTGEPFTVPTLENYHILVSSKELVKELIEAPEDCLSLHAIAKDMFQPRYTMNGFELNEQRGIDGIGYVRALRSILTANLPVLQPALRKKIESGFTEELAKHKMVNEWIEVPTFRTVKKVVAKANCYVFFGEHLSNEVDFLEAALRYPQDVFIAGEFLRITPQWLKSHVASMITHRNQASNTLVKYLTPIVQYRLQHRYDDGSYQKKPLDCMQWIIDTSPRKDPWTVTRMVHEIIALWFGSVHQLAMTFVYALYDLCAYPDHVEPLRQELESVSREELTERLDRMQFLDSFIKESARLSTSDSISIRRKAIAPFTFSNGLYIPQGNWVCVPQRALMRDPNYYAYPMTFDGFRFARNGNEKVSESEKDKPSRFTDVDHSYPIWGAGKLACPGRFYASIALKLMLAHVLLNYDCRLADENASRSFSWRSAIIPRSSTMLLMRPRKAETS